MSESNLPPIQSIFAARRVLYHVANYIHWTEIVKWIQSIEIETRKAMRKVRKLVQIYA